MTGKIPGNEPDTHDMAAEPAPTDNATPAAPIDPALAAEEEEAAKLGDFA